jgi:hypothetical protein
VNATADSYNVTVTWSNGGWSSPAACTWSCNSNYHTEDNETCISNTKQVACTQSGKPENSSYVT